MLMGDNASARRTTYMWRHHPAAQKCDNLLHIRELRSRRASLLRNCSLSSIGRTRMQHSKRALRKSGSIGDDSDASSSDQISRSIENFISHQARRLPRSPSFLAPATIGRRFPVGRSVGRFVRAGDCLRATVHSRVFESVPRLCARCVDGVSAPVTCACASAVSHHTIVYGRLPSGSGAAASQLQRQARAVNEHDGAAARSNFKAVTARSWVAFELDRFSSARMPSRGGI